MERLKTAVKGIKVTLSQYGHWLVQAIMHHEEPVPVFPMIKEGGIKVHIGSGAINLQGWINIDARHFPHTHIVTDNLELEMFSDGVIHQFYLCHVLEHFSYSDVDMILERLFEKLEPGGRVIISVPDFEKLTDIFLESHKNFNVIRGALMGGQGYAYNFHRSMFTERTLSAHLHKAGFREIGSWRVSDVFGVDLGDWASRKLPTPNGMRFISLNLCAIKPAN